MSQRNPNNDRYKDGGKKGVTKKSAGTAKPKSSAGSSVYYGSAKTKAKAKEDKAKERQAKQDASKLSPKDAETLSKARAAQQGYRHFRNVWLALIILACFGVVLSFVSPRIMCEGGMLEGLEPWRMQIQTVGLVLGYAALIAAFVVDFRKMRPIRKGAALQGKKLSKKERAHLEAAEAAKAQKKGLFGRKKQD